METALPAIEVNGVSLSLFDEIVESWGGAEGLEGLSTTEVNELFQKPSTFDCGSSTVSMLLKEGRHLEKIGPANVFVSHAWKYIFLDVVKALKSHFCEEEQSQGVFIWFDLFCNNQHNAATLPFAWWTNTFSASIERIGRTVMILSPWDAPVTLRRAWCLFEVYCTVEKNAAFDVAMCDHEEADFLSALTDGKSYAKFGELIAGIDVEQSEAFKDSDKDMIFAAVRTGPGFGTINLKVLRRIRQWVIDTVSKAIDAARRNAQKHWESDLKLTLGKLLIDQGLSERCIILLESEVQAQAVAEAERRRAEIRSSDADMIRRLDTCHYLAEAYWKVGRYEQASKLMTEVVRERLELLGDQHPDTLRTTHNLAMLLNSQCDYPASRALFEDCIAKRRLALGPDHLDTVQSQLGLAHVCTRVQENDAALGLYQRVLDFYTLKLGALHVDTLAVQNNLAYLYRQMGRCEEAVALFEDNISARRIKLGDEHPDTLRSKSNLAYTLNAVGRHAEAAILARQVQVVHSATIGPRHPYAIYNQLYLAHSLIGQGGEGNIEEAMALFKSFMPIGREVLGENNYQLLEHEALFIKLTEEQQICPKVI